MDPNFIYPELKVIEEGQGHMDNRLRDRRRRRSHKSKPIIEDLFSTPKTPPDDLDDDSSSPESSSGAGTGLSGSSTTQVIISEADLSVMSDIDRSYLRGKLRSLTRSKSCIETLSKWMLSRPEHEVNVIVTLWLDEIRTVNKNQLLPFLYLANAVMLNSRCSNNDKESASQESHRSFRKGFMKVMPYAAKVVAKDFSDDAQGNVIRLLGLWLSRKIAPREEIENISEVYLETWSRNQIKKPDEWDEEEDIPLNLLVAPDDDEKETMDVEKKLNEIDEDNGNESSNKTSPPLSPESPYYPGESPYEPIDSYEDDPSKKDEFKKFFECQSCIQLNEMDTESLLSIIRSEPDMRRLFLQKVPPNSILEVNLKPLESDSRVVCPKEKDLLALVETLCQLPSEDYDSRDVHNKFPDEFCIPSQAINLCTDSWSSNELGSSVKNALAILCIFLKRLDVEMGVRADATWKLQAFSKAQKRKLFLAQEMLQEERMVHAEMEEKLHALMKYVDNLSNNNTTDNNSRSTLPHQLHSSANTDKLPTVHDLFLHAEKPSEPE